MIVKELLDYCSAEGVAKVIAEMARVPKEGIIDLENRCRILIDELKSTENYGILTEDCGILNDRNFCFVAVKTNKYPNVPYVTLTHLNSLIENNYDIDKTTDYSWYWGQTLGVWVDEKSVNEFGADALIGGIIYHITYYDETEEEIKPLRELLKKKFGTKQITQEEFYIALNHEFCEQLKKMRNHEQ